MSPTPHRAPPILTVLSAMLLAGPWLSVPAFAEAAGATSPTPRPGCEIAQQPVAKVLRDEERETLRRIKARDCRKIGDLSKSCNAEPAEKIRSPRGLTFAAGCQGVRDGGFEEGSPSEFWRQESLSFDTLLCTVETCGDGLATAGPHAGEGWAWLGGFPGAERASLSQPVRFSGGAPAVLEFRLWHGAASGNGRDVLRVLLEDEPLFELRDGDAPPTDGYRGVVLALPPLDEMPHSLRFEVETFGPGVSNFSIDDVILRPAAPVDIPALGPLGALALGLLLAACGAGRIRSRRARRIAPWSRASDRHRARSAATVHRSRKS